jgi:hypothetical protein
MSHAHKEHKALLDTNMYIDVDGNQLSRGGCWSLSGDEVRCVYDGRRSSATGAKAGLLRYSYGQLEPSMNK